MTAPVPVYVTRAGSGSDTRLLLGAVSPNWNAQDVALAVSSKSSILMVALVDSDPPSWSVITRDGSARLDVGTRHPALLAAATMTFLGKEPWVGLAEFQAVDWLATRSGPFSWWLNQMRKAMAVFAADARLGEDMDRAELLMALARDLDRTREDPHGTNPIIQRTLVEAAAGIGAGRNALRVREALAWFAHEGDVLKAAMRGSGISEKLAQVLAEAALLAPEDASRGGDDVDDPERGEDAPLGADTDDG